MTVEEFEDLNGQLAPIVELVAELGRTEFVTEGVHDRFVAALTERMKGLVVDDALKSGVHIGPVVDQNQLDQDMSYITIGKSEGAKLHWGGARLKRGTPGFYL